MPDGYASALLKALISSLKADAALTALVGGRVYDEPPPAAVRPYVRIGAIEVRPLRSTGKSAGNLTFGIQSHSRPVAGRVEATRCAEAIKAALDEVDITVDGFTAVSLHWLTQTVDLEADGKSYLAISAFAVTLDG